MGEIFIGIGIGIVGLALLFMGYRFARVLLSVWGLVAGFMLGASFISDAMSSAFLGTLFGIVVGLVLGLLFAVLIYAYYYAAIVLMGASVGYWLGASFIGLFGIDPGFLGWFGRFYFVIKAFLQVLGLLLVIGICTLHKLVAAIANNNNQQRYN